VPRTHTIFAVFTDGSPVQREVGAPHDIALQIDEMMAFEGLAEAQFFGPWASQLPRFRAQRCFVISIASDVLRGEKFFTLARRIFLEIAHGAQGYALDVLRMWPFPLSSAEEALPEEFLPDDLVTLALREVGEHGFRAETYGFSKVGQREVIFDFVGRELLEEAALLIQNLADWLLTTGRSVSAGQSMSFGFDELKFAALEIDPVRSNVLARLASDGTFIPPGFLRVQASPPIGETWLGTDLTIPLRRSLEQRLVLEDFDLTGDTPHSSSSAMVRGTLSGDLRSLLAWRTDPDSPLDCGWRFSSPLPSQHLVPMALARVVERVPALMRYLSMPYGCRLEWDEMGQLSVDVSHAAQSEVQSDAEPP
jgi:hypothetical protein